MHPKFIIAHLYRAGSSPARLARELGVHHSAVQHIIYARRRSFRIAGAICRTAQLSPAEVFPGQYPLLEFALGAAGPAHELGVAA